MNKESPKKSQSSSRSPAEWVSFSIASLILAILFGLVAYRWFNGDDTPPILSVTIDPNIRQVNGQFYVPFTITNKGGRTAESIQVIAELTDGDLKESGEQQVDFLSGGEVQEGAFVFSHHPKEGKLIVRVASYKLP
ncbi:MAG TPA: TIGR02588 family protein [Cyanobacteria bacterium UBA11162]|nr:TIGR02588 family protein [Cyanobacteria bacterium UBA11162]